MDHEFSGNPRRIGAFRHESLQRWGEFFESAEEERAFFDDDRYRERRDDAHDMEQAAINNNPAFYADLDADRSEREMEPHRPSEAALEAARVEMAALMKAVADGG